MCRCKELCADVKGYVHIRLSGSTIRLLFVSGFEKRTAVQTDDTVWHYNTRHLLEPQHMIILRLLTGDTLKDRIQNQNCCQQLRLHSAECYGKYWRMNLKVCGRKQPSGDASPVFRCRNWRILWKFSRFGLRFEYFYIYWIPGQPQGGRAPGKKTFRTPLSPGKSGSTKSPYTH
jgi:hypothetical protein